MNILSWLSFLLNLGSNVERVWVSFVWDVPNVWVTLKTSFLEYLNTFSLSICVTLNVPLYPLPSVPLVLIGNYYYGLTGILFGIMISNVISGILSVIYTKTSLSLKI